MTRLHWILAGVALVTWIPSYIWLFNRDLTRWWTERRPRRAAAEKARAQQAAAKAALLDELATRYLAPGSGQRPQG